MLVSWLHSKTTLWKYPYTKISCWGILHSWISIVQHQWILYEKSTDEVYLFIGACCVHLGWLKILSFKTSTFASTSSLVDLPSLCPLCCKTEQTIFYLFFWVQEHGTQCVNNMIKSMQSWTYTEILIITVIIITLIIILIFITRGGKHKMQLIIG